mmetsp:Transcript_8015/g.19284  ORF Transcript_8015/g.19284 Transcript_8015/m.19284 type:complete len:707 (+) Transcript_8015:488-2608(+)|eukprot:CAMPEP_0178983482 /NCGR_PEP_ID=MMETSP0795-20121207/1081_1 /TAXON_ID=88552 /ORGANISM="Amoebophrya sp., Strain Ameob2" /LENGTH=706 /DNA_ID=CAMNT_0020674253 /DNA_START=372 /DNA_END=2492 /DNA_ORIENTATION=-
MRHKTDAWNCANAGFVCTVLLMILSVYADFVWVIVIPEIALVESGYLRSIQVQRRSAAPDAAYAPARQLQLDARLRADAAAGRDSSAIDVEVDDGDDEDEVELRRRPVSAVKILELEEREIPGGGSGTNSDDEETRTRTRSRIGREKSAGQNSDTGVGVPWSSTTTPERWSGDEEVGPTAARPAAPERVIPVPSSTSAAVPVRRAETETSLYSSRKDNGSGEQDGAEDTIFSTRNPTTALPGDEKVISSSSTSDRAATSPASVAESAFASLHKQTARTGTESASARPEEGQGVVEAGDRDAFPVASRADSEAGGRDSGARAGSTSSFDAGAALDGASDASSTGVRWSIRAEPAASASAAAGGAGAQVGDAAIRPIERPEDATRQEPQHSRLDEELLPPAEEEPLEELREDSPPWTRRSLASSEGGDFFWGLITEKQYDEFYYFYVKDAGIAVLLVFHFFFALLLMAFYHAIVIDPGQVPANWGFYMGDESKRRRYCKMCNVWKPDRTHHCSICRRCVLNMDHHCPWINNCVGFYNRKFFMLFVVYAWLCLMMVCVFGFVIVLDKVWRYLSVISPHNGPGFAVAGGLYNLVEARHVLMVLGQCGATLLGCTLTNFMKFHVRLISENYTTIENLERDEGQKSKYDVGVRRNWEQVFGSNVLTWWIPLPMPNSRPHGDGVRWRVHYTRLTDEDDELPEDDQPQHRKLLR